MYCCYLDVITNYFLIAVNFKDDKIVARIMAKRTAEATKGVQPVGGQAGAPPRKEPRATAEAKGKGPMPEEPLKKKIKSAAELPADIYKTRSAPRLGREETTAGAATKEGAVTPAAKRVTESPKVVDLTGATGASKKEAEHAAHQKGEKEALKIAFSPALGLKPTDSVFKSTRVARIIVTEGRLPEDIAFTSGLSNEDVYRRAFTACSQMSNLLAEVSERAARAFFDLDEKEVLEISLREALMATEENLANKSSEVKGLAAEKTNLRTSLDKADAALDEEHKKVHSSEEKLRLAKDKRRKAEEGLQAEVQVKLALEERLQKAEEALNKAEEAHRESLARTVDEYKSSAKYDEDVEEAACGLESLPVAEKDPAEPTAAMEADRMLEDDLPTYEVPQTPLVELPDLAPPSEDQAPPAAEENRP
ncbi:hypothetical protein NE237_020904 [Protea cynaroides]|uniref:Uncharacterized protein n=1 Tax=Protea cynaroides TaxID=273540 RepID=A0A9Q0K240_9MAGN|nr:hypothetical protein NE237_020904 [Protea cynaroides]